MGEVPIAPYETPGAQAFAETVVPFLKGTNTVILKNHGTVSFGRHLGAQAGYRSVVVHYLTDEDLGDLKMKGPYFGGVVRF